MAFSIMHQKQTDAKHECQCTHLYALVIYFVHSGKSQAVSVRDVCGATQRSTHWQSECITHIDII